MINKIRGSAILIFVCTFSAWTWYSGEKAKVEGPIQAEKKRLQDEKNDKEAYDNLWFNRFNVPSRPNRSIENFMTFLASEKMMDRAFEYIAYDGTVRAYEDYQEGLDGIASDEDRKMLDYYKESLKHKSHH